MHSSVFIHEDAYPFIPLNAPKMPIPGPSFVRAAALLAGDNGPPDMPADAEYQAVHAPLIQGTKQNKQMMNEPPYLRMLYTYALYESSFAMNILVKGQHLPCQFIPGHRWGDQRADGPRYPTDVVVIGKMPAREEALTGRNFVGPSGQVLRSVLDELHVPDAMYNRWYITNLLKFPHPTPWTGTGLTAAWLNDCAPLLWEELRLLRPKYVLCLGTEAAKAILGAKLGGITRSAGMVHEQKMCISNHWPVEGDELEEHSFQVVTALHPANVARDPDLLNQFRENIRLFANLVCHGKTTVERDYSDYHIIDNEQALIDEVDKVTARTPTGSVIAVDAEWHGDRPEEEGSYLRTIQFSDRKGYACCVVLHKQGGVPGFTALDGTLNYKAAIPQLRRLLKSTPERTLRIAGHFFRADLPQIRHHLELDLTEEHMAPPDDGTDSAHFRTAWEGGFDTGLAAHAVNEADDYKLEILGARHLGIPRWDYGILDWKTEECVRLKIKAGALGGYGECPEDVLYAAPPHYALTDVDATRQLVDIYNGDWPAEWDMQRHGLLDNDGFRHKLQEPDLPHGLNSRKSFWIGMRAMPAAAEMEHFGLRVDKDRAEQMIDIYTRKRDQLLSDLRQEVAWGDFKPTSPHHCRELLYGVGFSGTFDKKSGGTGRRVSLPGAILCNMQPVKATGKDTKRSWSDLVSAGEDKLHTPSTDKETLGILSAQSPVARKLRNIKFLTQLLNTTLKRPTQVYTELTGTYEPTEVEKTRAAMEGKKVSTRKKIKVYKDKTRIKYKPHTDAADPDDWEGEEERVYDAGLLSYINSDGRIRTHLFQTLETGRWASARPNLTNISKRREDDYKRILGDDYIAPIRSIFVASPGYVLIEADILGAELAVMGWDSQDAKMIEHVRRAQLPESHPDFYDIHSNVAVTAFRLTVPNQKAVEKLADIGIVLQIGDPCPPLKDALAACGYKSLRVAAKNVIFGFAYGRGAEAISRQCKEEGADVSIAQAQQLIDNLIIMYPGLAPFFGMLRGRVSWPGWQRSDFGYLRRTTGSNDRKVLGDIERQFMNFRVQNAVAGAVSRACDYLIEYRKTHPNISYRMCLQIHDALLLEVPVQHAEYVYDVVLPECMVKSVPIWPCDADGERLTHIKEPYYFGIDREVMLRWGEKIVDVEAARAWGVPERFIKKPKKAA